MINESFLQWWLPRTWHHCKWMVLLHKRLSQYQRGIQPPQSLFELSVGNKRKQITLVPSWWMEVDHKSRPTPFIMHFEGYWSINFNGQSLQLRPTLVPYFQPKEFYSRKANQLAASSLFVLCCTVPHFLISFPTDKQHGNGLKMDRVLL